MQTKLDEAKAELLERAARVGESSPAGGSPGHGLGPEALTAFLQRYYLHSAPEDLVDRDPVDVFGAALSHYRLAELRPQGTANVRVHTPTVEENGWQCSHTVVEVVTDDMPFLVDSVTNALTQANRAIHVVFHPQFQVRRDVTGKLLEVIGSVGGPDDEPLSHDVLLESWIHVEIDRETDRADLQEITAELRRVLSDVREAVEDWTKMRQAALSVADELAAAPPPLPEQETGEAWELMRWLADDHFTFLGYREYELITQADPDGTEEDALVAVPGTGLGILRSDPLHPHGDATRHPQHPGHPHSPSFSRLPADARAKAREHKLLILTKANSRSTVHRPSYLDYVGVKKFDAEGNVTGERRFLGLFSSAAYTESVRRVPVIRRKVEEVLEGAGFSPDSHDGRDLLQILETYPRDELFQTPTDELRSIVTSVLYLQERRKLRLFLRQDEYGRYFSALVYLPRDRYTTAVRLRLTGILQDELGGQSVDYSAWNTESVLSRLHFVIRVDPGTPLPLITDGDVERIENRLSDATRSWADGFAEALTAECGEERAAELSRRYAQAFPDGYRADFTPRSAVADLQHIESLGADDFSLSLYEPVGASPQERRFKIYRTGAPVSLSAVLPVLQRLGVEVVDERPYEMRLADQSRAWIYDFGLRLDQPPTAGPDPMAALDNARGRFQEAFAATWTHRAENDGFNSLVLRAGLDWRQAMVLRAYAKYLRQAGSTFSQDYMEDTLRNNVHLTRLLVNLFQARLSPDHQRAGSELTDGLLEELDGALDQVASLDEDRILRSFLTLIKATLRTNYFQRGQDGRPHPYLSLKFDPQAIPDLPAPRPAFEIWVYSPRVEGVHLRFGKVARGGLRWSDRREDFRTEVLGLVKAQMVKNTVIVPVGAKGGFVGKRLPDPAVDRDAWLAEGIASYRTFISGLLDITDNLVAGEVVPPRDVVRHDGDDAYLVVAADKGTASFSDIANEVAGEYGFWLGDAFASGGSVGYDHKKMAITSSGAWESVKRHFREMGHNTQEEDFTVVGIGDMSGDVFGNGMLLSEHIRLVAAFDHRHIFIDPKPDAATSYAERRRLFELERSSWADYDTSLLSPGGGVFPRTAKAIPLNSHIRAALGIETTAMKLTPAELMKAILQAPVDLLWNGGIGTYVKASTESHADAGDKANDAIRIDGDALRVRVVGEGGNLGFTQLGRIEFARTGGRINTDAIDNSAGVDASDHEVNIKILLNSVVADGDLTVKQRNSLLAEMTHEVGNLVLRNNYAQNVVLANSMAQSTSLLHAHQRFIRHLVSEGRLDRALEFLPTDRQIRERLAAGQGLTQPEIAVILAYAKITAADELIHTDLPDDPYLRSLLHAYFPVPLRERFGHQIDHHALRREIATTLLVNDTVNTGGTTFLQRFREEIGATTDEIVRAHTAARAIFALGSIWDEVESLDNIVPAAVQTRIRLHSRRLVERATRWLLNNRPQPLRIAETIDFFGEGVALVWSQLPKLLRGADLEWFQTLHDELTSAAVPEELANRVAGFSAAFPILDVVDVAHRTGNEPLDVAEVYFDLADRLGITQLLDRIILLPRADRWQSMARSAVREDLFAAHAALTADVLAAGTPGATPEQRYRAWEEKNAGLIGRARVTLEEIQGAEEFDLASLSVAMRTFRTLLRAHR
ncbi:NAD-glutamate dehydrogenase [Streptomyces sp.]|uniref:NAD-glutamate dehydrogenase n=1 Tax=Streptomyces sp. TaxID=1931 RepID=UPI002F3F2E6A